MFAYNHFLFYFSLQPFLKFIVVWLNEKEKFAELFDDSGLDRRKFHQKKNFQEIASF